MRIKSLLLFLFLPFWLLAGYPHKAHSVLQSGYWYRISLQTTGIYKITYNDFVSMGFDPLTMDPAMIRVYGNGGGILPESNATPRVDDLLENSIYVQDGGDGKLDQGDFVLFYGEAPDKWMYDYNSRIFTHQKNLYSDSTYYFITIGTEAGKRVQDFASLTTTPDTYSLKFIDHAFHDVDSVNLIQSGKTWVGETFTTYSPSRDFSFYFPRIDSMYAARIVTHVVAKSALPSLFRLSDQNGPLTSIHITETNPQSDLFAKDSTKVFYLLNPQSQLNFNLAYQMNEPSATGWLDYIEVVCQQKLQWAGPQMSFRDPNTIAIHVSQFMMTKTNPNVVIWDVTKKNNIMRILPVMTDSTVNFRVFTDSLKEFIGFDGSSYLTVHLSGTVPNQDLHNLNPASMIILTHPLFRQQADSLAEFHRTSTGLTVDVVDVEQVYTEFGCGQHDLTAIRDFMKMLYDKGYPGNEPHYLLLFGDGTYDPKNRITANNNFIPTYESSDYLNTTASYLSDDYFGIMGDNEGSAMNGSIEIGIGRLPANTVVEASNILSKIIRYSSLTDSTQADWRNTFTFVADDPNSNLHMQQAEQLADTVKRKYPVFNVKKIYNDAYKFTSTPAGLRSPECEKAINKAVQDGTIVFSYTGHGGEDGWSGTKILNMNDINSWTNNYRLPVFITATCEFGRFDNPNRPTGGELVITKPDGGAIAIFTTTRKAFASANIQLAASFFSHIKSVNADDDQKMGDLIRIVKNENANNSYIRNFVLLGDPAQNIAYPKQNVVTTAINGQPVNSVSDTALGMSKMTIKGEVRDYNGNKLNNFNGLVFPKVFDKPVIYTTLGNTSDSYPQSFAMQNRLLYSGQSLVTNGEFEFSFIVPKSIGLQFGKGKISYYTRDPLTDANGFDTELVFGGEDSGADTVFQGPDISLYMNNTSFVSGNSVDKDPVLLAYLTDNAGINNVNLGIGHDIVAVLDQNEAHPIGLNNYYMQATDDYTRGMVYYPFFDLPAGFHSVSLKAWNMHDLSSEKEIYFWVSDPKVPVIRQVINFPNPVTTGTTFLFSSMNITGDLDVQILIYSSTGQLIRTLEKKFAETGQASQSIIWDGNGNNGHPVGGGIYPYRVIIRGSNGTYAQASQKLVIAR
ncbi:MAG: type IX secretion system sortase PorU [Bacteroidetes bacterium]|nr:type IX secretion system sortase PorU [Bacteroidota bacterium]